MTYQDNHITIYNRDSIESAESIIPAGSVDLIFTDPPYHQEFHYCYEWLAKEAVRVLKPNGFIITYLGPYWKHKVMMTLGEYLDYFYDFILMHRGNTSILWPRRIITGYKSLLCYRLKDSTALPRTNVLGKYDWEEVKRRMCWCLPWQRKPSVRIKKFREGGRMRKIR